MTIVECPTFRVKMTLKSCIKRRNMARSMVRGDAFMAAVREACAECELGKQRTEERDAADHEKAVQRS